jgi:two-component system, NarL family, sensor kinase
MAYHKQYAQLLYQYEILLARLSVREHFLKTVVREVYENIGQVLSLIRVQLSTLQTGFAGGNNSGIDSSGELVGQTIRELRTMCRLFYPEENMLTNQGLINAIQSEIKMQSPEAVCTFPDGPLNLSGLDEDRSVLLYSIILELLQLVHHEKKGLLNTAGFRQDEKKLILLLEYTGGPIRRPHTAKKGKTLNLSVYDRVEMMGGTLEIKKAGTGGRRIKLALPIQ